MTALAEQATGLAASGLTIGYRDRRGGGASTIVLDADLTLERGKMIGLAGESGSGKSTLATALVGFRAPASVISAGRIVFSTEDLLSLNPRQLARLWGNRLAYVPQDATTALDPSRRIGFQFREHLKLHLGYGRAKGTEAALGMLESVGIPEPEEALRRYPHEFSGGQQQRLSIGLAMSCKPEVLILDEPTTGLDSTTQAQVNGLIADLVRSVGTATLYVSHDLAMLGGLADTLAVMYAGQIVELGPTAEVLAGPLHPYTGALLASTPRLGDLDLPQGILGRPPPSAVPDACAFAPRCSGRDAVCEQAIPLRAVGPARSVRCARAGEPELAGKTPLNGERDAATGPSAIAPAPGEIVLEATDLRCVYRDSRRELEAVSGVSFQLARGEILGIVGGSGSGKSTLLRALAGLLRPASGEIRLDGTALAPTARARDRETLRRLQIVFQNPDASLNPSQRVETIIGRPLALFFGDLDAAERRRRLVQSIEAMHLDPSTLDRFPHQLSGGQRQRVAIARALAAEPDVILCDEVTSALDVSVQATIVELLHERVAGTGVSLLFVTHDLALLRPLADRVMVMMHGAVLEQAPSTELFETPKHPYTKALLASVAEG